MVQPLVFLSIAIVCDLLKLVCELSQIPTIPHLQPQGGVNVEIYGKLMRDFRGSVTLAVDFSGSPWAPRSLASDCLNPAIGIGIQNYKTLQVPAIP